MKRVSLYEPDDFANSPRRNMERASGGMDRVDERKRKTAGDGEEDNGKKKKKQQSMTANDEDPEANEQIGAPQEAVSSTTSTDGDDDIQFIGEVRPQGATTAKSVPDLNCKREGDRSKSPAEGASSIEAMSVAEGTVTEKKKTTRKLLKGEIAEDDLTVDNIDGQDATKKLKEEASALLEKHTLLQAECDALKESQAQQKKDHEQLENEHTKSLEEIDRMKVSFESLKKVADENRLRLEKELETRCSELRSAHEDLVKAKEAATEASKSAVSHEEVAALKAQIATRDELLKEAATDYARLDKSFKHACREARAAELRAEKSDQLIDKKGISVPDVLATNKILLEQIQDLSAKLREYERTATAAHPTNATGGTSAAENSVAKAELEKALADVKKLSEENDRLTAENIRLIDADKRMTAEVTSLRGKEAESRAELGKKMGEVAALKKEMASKVPALVQELEASQKKYKALEESVRKRKENEDKERAEMAEMQAELENLRAVNSALVNTPVGVLKKELEELKLKLNSAKSTDEATAQLRKKLLDSESRRENLQVEMEKRKAEEAQKNAVQRASLIKHSITLANMERENGELKNEIKGLRALNAAGRRGVYPLGAGVPPPGGLIPPPPFPPHIPHPYPQQFDHARYDARSHQQFPQQPAQSATIPPPRLIPDPPRPTGMPPQNDYDGYGHQGSRSPYRGN